MRNKISESERLWGLNSIERIYRNEGLRFIAGVDEVGRGPLCGPVAAACVVFDKEVLIPYLNDSKKLSQKRREEMFPLIIEAAIDFSFCCVPPETIDEINILEATKLAMKNAVRGLKRLPDIVLVDALHIPDINCRQTAVTGGDGKCAAIAAASVIAKVKRDKIMEDFSRIYPGYGLEKNKGYGTKEHISAIKSLGLTEIHRKSFCKGLI